MKINSRNSVVCLLLFLFFVNVNGQKKVENIGSEVVNVVKPYDPTLSDAFKIKEIPKLNDVENSKKIALKYNIFSFPVASTFSPAKGVASDLAPTIKPIFFKNYLSIGLGNYNSANIDFFINKNIGENQFFRAMLRHESSQGGIRNIDLKNHFYITNMDLAYENNQEYYTFKTDIGLENMIYNWYGLPQDFGINLLPADKQLLLNTINPTQSYKGVYGSGTIIFKDNFFKDINLKYNRFWDDYGSIENRFISKSNFEIAIKDEIIKTDINIDYVAGSFKNKVFDAQYNVLNLCLNPNYNYKLEDLTVNLGLNLVLGADYINTKNRLFLYPKITASYKIVSDYMIVFGGIEGNLNQNSYRNLVQQNPFLSPTLLIAPTDSQYNLSFGLMGKLSNLIAYNISGSFLNEVNRALFKSNDYSETLGNPNFSFGNSFKVVYDNLKTVSLKGELKASFSKNIECSIGGTYNSFNTNFEQEAWNLPQIQIDAATNLIFSEKWFAGVNLYFVGERKDFQTNLLVLGNNKTQILDAFFDINCNVGYNHSKQLTAFLKANNIANQGYQKWLNFPVQQFQLVLGAAYKFDF